MRLIITILAYNEEAKLAETIGRVRESLKADFYTKGAGAIFQEKLLQVIDDGSRDNTFSIARQLGALAYSNDTNRGIGRAFRHAVERALENGADIMVTLDADGQFDPQDIPELLFPVLRHEADMVSADRFGDHRAENIPFAKDVINRLAAYVIGRFMNAPIKDLTCGFRAYNRETLLRLNLPGDFTYTQETIIDALGKNLRLQWVSVKVTYFADRQSRVVRSVFQYVNASARIIVKAVRDVRPMKFFGVPGSLLILVSFVFFGIFLFNYFNDGFKISPYRNQLFFGAGFFIVGLQFVVFALMADMIRSNRRLIEDQFYFMKKEKYSR
jgi:glycosyltransferase involved in cell wall biosynthesis